MRFWFLGTTAIATRQRFDFGPQPFAALVNTWQRIHPVDLVTLEPLDQAAATQAVVVALVRLEPFLYVLAEQQG